MITDINKNYFRPILEEHGLRDERGEDDGLGFQDMLRDFRYKKTRQSWIMTKSMDVSSICLVLVTLALA